jgi:hypothetical protein
LVLPGTLSTVCTTDFVYGWCDDGNNTPGGGGFSYGYYGSPVVTANGSSDLSASTKGGVSSSTGSVPNPIVVVEEDTYWPGSELGYPNNWWLDDQWLDENFSLDTDGIYSRLTTAEKTLIALYSEQAYKISLNKNIAEQETIKQFGRNGLNDKSDAFRHCYFQAINTNVVGWEMTKLFSDAHESETPKQLTIEREMDLFNNQIGIDISIRNKRNATSLQVMDALLNGKLKYLTPLDFDQSPRWPQGLDGIISSTQLVFTNQ